MFQMFFVYFEKHSQEEDYLGYGFFMAIFKLYVHYWQTIK